MEPGQPHHDTGCIEQLGDHPQPGHCLLDRCTVSDSHEIHVKAGDDNHHLVGTYSRVSIDESINLVKRVHQENHMHDMYHMPQLLHITLSIDIRKIHMIHEVHGQSSRCKQIRNVYD